MTAELVEGLRRRKLQAADGVMIVQRSDDHLLVFASQADDRNGLSITEDADLEALGLVIPALTDDPGHGHAFLWNEGWPVSPAGEAVVLTGVDRAMLLPAKQNSQAIRTAVLRFIAGMSPGLGPALLDVLDGKATVLSVRPVLAVAELLADPPRLAEHPALALDGHGWHTCRLDDLTGPLAPAIAISRWRFGTQVIATTPVLPSPAGIGFQTSTAAGIRSDEDEAAMVASAEAFERHTAGVVPAGDLEAGTIEDVDGALDPDAFIAYASWQHALHGDLVPFDRSSRRLWARGSKPDGTPVAILADLVFYPFGRSARRAHTNANSSGMAAHTTAKRALLGSWAELVERDAFMRHWLGRLPGRIVDPPPEDQVYDDLARDLSDRGWTLSLLQLGASPCLPVLCAMAERHGMVVLGASAGSATEAARTAVREAWAGVVLTQEEEPIPRLEDVRSPSDHRRLYRWGGLGEAVEFLRSGSEVVRLPDLDELPPIPSSAALYVWPQAGQPLAVARVLVPELVPITFGYQREPLGRPDVQDLLARRGCDGRGMLPHPFP